MYLWVWPDMMSKKASVSFKSDDMLAFIMQCFVMVDGGSKGVIMWSYEVL